MTNIRTDAQLRALMRTARRTARLSQDAAAKRAGVSRTWWRRVENASQTTATEDTVVDMLRAVDVQPEHLDTIGHSRLADNLRQRQEFERQVPRQVSLIGASALEEYLLSAPAPEKMRTALVITARTMEEVMRGDEPFADHFPGPDRRRSVHNSTRRERKEGS